MSHMTQQYERQKWFYEIQLIHGWNEKKSCPFEHVLTHNIAGLFLHDDLIG